MNTVSRAGSIEWWTKQAIERYPIIGLMDASMEILKDEILRERVEACREGLEKAATMCDAVTGTEDQETLGKDLAISLRKEKENIS